MSQGNDDGREASQRTTVLRTITPQALEALHIDLTDPAKRRIGDYELEALLGEGGMGVVYRARQRSLDRPVALKLLAAGPRGSREFLERFRIEAQSAARMQHPNIVTIHEIGATDEVAYFSMQLVEGETLAQVLRRTGAFDPQEAARTLRTLAEAVEYAHALGVLHLDLKPANVLRDTEGRLFIADFGLARPLDHAVAVAGDEISGTPSYMAPEQIELRRHKLSRGTDIYGLGAILFELLSGRPPFLGASPQATMQRVLDEPAPSPRTLRRQVPRDLEAICAKCLAKDPAQRYASARALAEDLGRFLDGHAISIRRPGVGERLKRWYRKNPASFSGVAAAAVIVFGGLLSLGYVWLLGELRNGELLAIAQEAARSSYTARLTPDQRVRSLFHPEPRGEPRHWRDGLEEDAEITYREAVVENIERGRFRRDAALATALSRSGHAWRTALAGRDTPGARLLAADFDVFNLGHHDFGTDFLGWALDQYRRASDAEPDETALVAAYVAVCRIVDREIPERGCDAREAINAWLDKDPADIAAVAAGATAGFPPERLDAAIVGWTVTPPAVRRHETALARIAHDELLALSPRVLADIGAQGVEPEAFAAITMLLASGWNSTYFRAADGVGDAVLTNFDALVAHCAVTVREDVRRGCAAAAAALREGRGLTHEIAAARALGAPDEAARAAAADESKRIVAWRRQQLWPLLAYEAPYETDRRYLRLLLTEGPMPAADDLLQRHGIALEPPADWTPPKR